MPSSWLLSIPVSTFPAESVECSSSCPAPSPEGSRLSQGRAIYLPAICMGAISQVCGLKVGLAFDHHDGSHWPMTLLASSFLDSKEAQFSAADSPKVPVGPNVVPSRTRPAWEEGRDAGTYTPGVSMYNCVGWALHKHISRRMSTSHPSRHCGLFT